jgi:hypothetical protein
MQPDRTPVPLTVLVVALQGGEALTRVLRAATWASECVVLDPATLTAATGSPADLQRQTTGAAALALATQPWVWLMTDRESVPVATQESIRAFVAGAPGDHAARVHVAQHGCAAHLAPRAAPVRLAPRRGARVAVDARLDVVLATTAAIRFLSGNIERRFPDGVAEATRSLEPESRAMAALLADAAARPTIRAALAAASTAAWGVRTARRVSDQSIAAMVAGYCVVLSFARLWEQAYAAGAVR